MSKITKSVLDQIKSKKIRPKPRWHFILKSIFVWTLVVFVTLIGGFFTSIVMRRVTLNEWDVYHKTGRGLMSYIFYTLPYFWIVWMVAAIVIAIYYFKKTKRAYKYKLTVIVGVMAITSIILGAFIYYGTDYSYRAERYMNYRMPMYSHLGDFRKRVWQNPKEGLLAGEIIDIMKNKIIVKGLDDNTWYVDYSDAEIRGSNTLEKAEMIKVIGEKVGDLNFKAEQIRPWIPRHNMWHSNKEMNRGMRIMNNKRW